MKKLFTLFAIVILLFISGCNKIQDKKEYKVEFYVESEVVETITVEEGSKITKPSDPILEGYIFDGWFVDDERWLFSSGIITSNLKLTAKFISSEYSEKIVPVYQGMEASKENKALRHNKKDIKDEVLPSIDVIETEGVEFFARKGEKYLVTVHLYNPSSYEILSFTLDGKKYQSYEFKEGSNSTELIIELTAPNASGIKDLTIDAIKYVDGTEIKDVRMDGERTIHIGVAYEVTPTASLINEEINTTSYTSSFEILDNSNILNIDTDLLVFLYDGTSIIEKSNLKLGINVLEFRNLKMSQEYQYIIVGVYDKLDGAGKCAYVLYEGLFKTKAGIEINNISSTKKEISFDLTQNNTSTLVEIIELYHNDTLITTSTTSATFTDLLSNTEYKIVLKYKYEFKETVVYSQQEYLIKTKELASPVVNLDALTADKKQINYQVNKIDTDNTIKSINIKLYHGENLINSSLELKSLFDNLRSNTTYELEVSYEYDLNDGLGVVKDVISKKINTLALVTPKLEVITKVDPTTVNFELVLTDLDNTANLSSIKLYKGEELINSLNDLELRTISNLVANVPYTLVVEYIYDLNDGSDVQTLIESKNFQTGKTTPELSLSVKPNDSTAEFTIKTKDPNTTGHLESIKIYKEDLLIEELENLSLRVIENLSSNTSYKLQVSYLYDLDDGNGAQELKEEITFKTTKDVPSVNFTSSETFDSSSVNITINDKDSSGTLKDVKLLLNGVEIVKHDTTDNLEFNNLLSNTSYTLALTYSYDLNDGLELRESIFEYSFKTLEKSVPVIDMSVYPYEKAMKVNVGINDRDNVLIDKTIKCYNKEMLIEETKELSYEFNNLTSNTIYNVIVTLEYDLNDGLGVRTISKSLEALTSKVKPTVSINPLSITNSNIYFELLVSDNDAVCEIASIGLYKDKTLVQRVLDLQTRDFQSLDSYSNYEIRVTYQYDLKDGNGTVGSTYSYTFNTAKLSPSIEYSEQTPLFEEYNVEFVINDEENAGTLTSLKLIYNDEVVNEITSFKGTKINHLYKDLYSNSTYTIEALYTYDLCDLEGVRTTVFKQTFSTPKKETPSVEISNVSASYEQISFEHLINNPDSVKLTLKELAIIDKEKTIYDTALTTITNLNSSKELVLSLTWSYDLNDNTGEHLIEIKHEVETLTYADPLVNLDNIITTYNIIEFNTELDYHNDIDFNITSSALYLGDVLIKEFNSNSIYVDNLYAGRTYKYIMAYAYDLHDGNGLQEVTYEKEIKTLSYDTPKFIFNKLFVDNSNIAFELQYEDKDNLMEKIVSVSLYDGEENVISEILKENYEYHDLLSNHNYRLVIEYIADFKDGYGMVTKEYEHLFITKTKQTPIVEITNVNSKTYSIGFSLNIKDKDNVSEIINYEIYNQGTLINTLSNGDALLFDNLQTGVKYLIRVNYQYDLQDGTGTHTSYVEKEILTIDELIQVTSIDVLNSGYVKTNEELHLRICIENPNELTITALQINNTVIDVTDSHVIDTVYIKFVPDTTGGLYKISVNGLEYESQGLIASQKISEPYSKVINIVGKLNILSVKAVNEANYYTDCPSFLIEIENGSNFELNNVTVSLLVDHTYGHEITVTPTKVSENIYRIDILEKHFDNSNLSYVGLKVVSVDYVEKGYNLSDTFINSLETQDLFNKYCVKAFIFNPKTFKGIVNISSAEEFINLEDTLTDAIINVTKDIDFNGFSISTKSLFKGVILGNGYSFKNISVINGAYYGLFNSFMGYVENFKIDNIYIDSPESVSGFAASATCSTFNNVTIDGYIKSSSTAVGLVDNLISSYLYNVQNKTTIEGEYASGFSSNAYETKVDYCANYGKITAFNNASGLFNNFMLYEENDALSISRCANYGKITGSYAAGFVGYLTNAILINSVNYGDIEGGGSGASLIYNCSQGKVIKSISIGNLTVLSSNNYGGLVYEMSTSLKYDMISDSIFIGTIKTYAYGIAPILGIWFFNGSSQDLDVLNDTNYFYINMIRLNDPEFIFDGTTYVEYGNYIDLSKFNDASFYKDTLGYDPLIWDYENLDVENGIYPTLR